MNKRVESKLKEKGWIVECQSPLELRHNVSGSTATGHAAVLVIEDIIPATFDLECQVTDLQRKLKGRDTLIHAILSSVGRSVTVDNSLLHNTPNILKEQRPAENAIRYYIENN